MKILISLFIFVGALAANAEVVLSESCKKNIIDAVIANKQTFEFLDFEIKTKEATNDLFTTIIPVTGSVTKVGSSPEDEVFFYEETHDVSVQIENGDCEVVDIELVSTDSN